MTGVFVTGGSGFIGGRLIERLRRDGHAVRALARSASAAERVRARGAEPIEGDKAREQLGYAPVKTLHEGLAELRAG